MTLYWLSHNGDAPTGPLLPSQLRIMRDQGRIGAEDLICVDGTEDWQPVTTLFGGETPGGHAAAQAASRPLPSHLHAGWMPKDEVPPDERPVMKIAMVVGLLACLGTVLYVTFAPMLKPTWSPDKQFMQREAIKSWAVTNFRDPLVQLVEVGGPLRWDDGDLRLVRLKLDGVVNTYVIQFKWGTRQVTNWWTPTQWQERYGKTDKAVAYADTARAIYSAFEKRLPNAEADAGGGDAAVSKP